MRRLLVEDEARIAAFIRRGLEEEGHAIDLASDGDEAMLLATTNEYDTIVLDVMLPRRNGFAVCRELRAQGVHTPILMLTARDSVEDRVTGLNTGADDYLTKPFDFDELVARIRALARRTGPALPPTLAHGDLTVDPARRVAARGEVPLSLSPKEFAVLEYLLTAQGRVVSAEELLERVWDEAANPFTTTVKTTIGRLRGKLGEPPLIETVREAGYRI